MTEDGQATTAHVLRCSALVKEHPSGFRLGPIDLELGPGVTCLVGANGAGKSTLFRLVAGVERPTSGSVGTGSGADGGRRRGAIGYLPQQPTLPGGATLTQFLTYVGWLQGMSRSARGPAVAEVLARMGLADRAGARIASLSGGMQRRAGVAQAILHGPGTVLLDEPTAGLDPRQRLSLRSAVQDMAAGRIVVVATHLVEDVRALADRVVVLADGCVTFNGEIAALEGRATADAPGATELERGLANLMGTEE